MSHPRRTITAGMTTLVAVALGLSTALVAPALATDVPDPIDPVAGVVSDAPDGDLESPVAPESDVPTDLSDPAEPTEPPADPVDEAPEAPADIVQEHTEPVVEGVPADAEPELHAVPLADYAPEDPAVTESPMEADSHAFADAPPAAAEVEPRVGIAQAKNGMFARINDLRTAAGRDKLIPNYRLHTAAEWGAQNIRTNGTRCTLTQSQIQSMANVIFADGSRWNDSVLLYGCNYSDGVRFINDLAKNSSYLSSMRQAKFDRIGVGFFKPFDPLGNATSQYYVAVLAEADGFPALRGQNLYSGSYTPTFGDEHNKANRAFGRWEGQDRYDTSFQVNSGNMQANKPLVVASADNFPDALAGGPAAAKLGGDLIVVGKAAVKVNTMTLLRAKKPSRIIVIGGPNVISAAAYNQLKAVQPNIERIHGKSRYETSELVYKKFWAKGTPAFVATGRNFPDALAGAVLAGQKKLPIVLTHGAQGYQQNVTTRNVLHAHGTRSVTFLGGKAALNLNMEALYREKGITATRISGSSRFETATKIASQVVNKHATTPAIIMATGRHYADALSASVVGARVGWPVVLTERTCVPASTVNWINARNHKRRQAAGGKVPIADSAYRYLQVCG